MSRRNQSTAERHARRARRKAPDFTDAEWQEVQRRAGYSCVYCGKHTAHLEVEHGVPLSKGGGNSIQNIYPACRQCNQRKGNRSVYEILPTHEVKDLHRRLHAPQHPDTVTLERLSLRLVHDYFYYHDPAAAHALRLLFALTGQDCYSPAYIDREFARFLKEHTHANRSL